jgi:hypothetical protein
MENENVGNTRASGISTEEREADITVLRFMGMTAIEAGALQSQQRYWKMYTDFLTVSMIAHDRRLHGCMLQE